MRKALTSREIESVNFTSIFDIKSGLVVIYYFKIELFNYLVTSLTSMPSTYENKCNETVTSCLLK